MDLEAESIIKIDTAKSADIATNCNKLLETQKEINTLEEKIKTLKETERNLSDNIIPNLMRESGLDMLRLTDGSKVEVKPFYNANITEAFRERAHNWLRENNADDIIKNTITLQFGKGEDDKANTVMQEALQKGYVAKQKTAVHPMTLRGFVKDRILEGKPVPSDLFSVYVANRVTIKQEDK